MQKKTDPKYKPSLVAGYAAIVIVTILIAAKAYAYYQSGSLSILSSLTDSCVDSLVSVMALGSIYYARRPADEDHRWGHGKMEAVSALFQAAIIAGGAVFLIFESINHVINPTPVVQHTIGIYVLILAIVLSGVLVFIQRLCLKQQGSLAIEADSLHYASDILINAGALIVLVALSYGASIGIDFLFALGVAIFMVVTAGKIALKSLDMLLDRELPDEDRQKIITVIESHDLVIGWHDLRTYMNGQIYVISFDIEVDRELSLWEAHDITKDLEGSIIRIHPESDIIIHVDPEGFTEDSRHRVKGIHH